MGGAAGRGIVRFRFGLLGGGLGLPQACLRLLQGGALALQPVQQAVLRQRVGGFRQQPRRLALRLLGVLLSLPVLPEPLRLLLLLPQGLLGLQLLRLTGQAVQLLLGRGGLTGQVVPVGLLALQLGDLPLQRGDLAVGAVAPAAVQLFFQSLLYLGVGNVLLAGGDEGGNTALQLCIAVHRQRALSDEGAALKHLTGYAQQRLAGVLAVDARHGGGGAGVGTGELPHRRVGAAGVAGQGKARAVAVRHLKLSPHGGAAPRREAVFVRQIAPFAGAQAVQHDPQEVAPCGFSGFVGGVNAVQPRLQG